MRAMTWCDILNTKSMLSGETRPLYYTPIIILWKKELFEDIKVKGVILSRKLQDRQYIQCD